MGKRRNTAKTGDKAIYKGRPKHETRRRNDGDGDGDNNMYNEIDRFHNERDQDEYIRFDNENDGDDDDDKDLVGNKEAVLDLGVRGEESSSSDDEDDDDDDDSSSSEEKRHTKSSENMDGSDSNPSSSDSESDGESSDDDDDIKNLKDQLKAVSEDPRKWGKKKSLYYHGDTADLEIGQEEDDAFLEEEAAKEIQASRFEEMDEDDFVLSDDEEAADAKNAAKARTNTEKIEAARDVSKLSKKQARKLIQKQHPELLPMVSYFADVVKDLRDRTDVVTKALMEGEGTAEVSA
jgi:U3 small nucleolar RNA-associated protein 3